jgi:hypothetical protein
MKQGRNSAIGSKSVKNPLAAGPRLVLPESFDAFSLKLPYQASRLAIARPGEQGMGGPA